jgi:small subunit ribosomal protein S17
MSEQNDTPEAEAEVPTEVAEEVAAVEEAEAAPVAEPVTPLTPKERKVASRARRGQRRSSTPEERAAERKQKAAARSRWRANAKKRRAERGDGPGQPTPPAEPAETNPQTRLGTVVSSKADKTITVRIDTARRHKRYQKIVRRSYTLHAHDEANQAGEGDLVRVVECRPMSRTKRWRLTDVVEKAK